MSHRQLALQMISNTADNRPASDDRQATALALAAAAADRAASSELVC